MSESYDQTKLLSDANVTNWDHHLRSKLLAYPVMGVAIRQGVPYVAIKPTVNDLFDDEITRKYTRRANGVELNEDSRKDFLSALNFFEKTEFRRKEEEAKICALLASSYSGEAQMSLRTNKEYTLAENNNNSYDMYTIAKAAHTRVTSFSVAQHAFEHLTTITMTGSFAAYMDALLSARRDFDAIFDPTSTGNMPIDNIFTMVLVNGLPEDFRYMKDKLYSEDLHEAFPKFDVVYKAMQTYDLNKKKARPSSASSTHPSPTVLAATSSTPTGTLPICNTCHLPFPKVISRTSGKPFTRCASCSLKAKTAATATVPIAPTPQQIISAQSQIKKAQAVLLAANVDLKVTSTTEPIPPSTPHSADSLNQYMQSNHYSLTATASFPAPPAEELTRPWIPDSGASFSIAKDIRDIHLPTKLHSPIPITGADGSIIYATHVGPSRFDSNHPVYFVPRAAVNLVSLGALTASGYTVHTDKNRSIVITRPSGVILCTCPIQTNNTWVFPTYLMTGKLPTAAVITGISGTPAPTVLPFSIPHERRHFTKEEVKRATQARELHHFLSHPNDQALKSTLDQGHLSHHTHLTSQDVDLMTKFYGSCMACTIGKLHNSDLHVTSLSPPSTKIGQCVFFDLQQLSTPSIGGNHQAIISIDDRSGFISVFGSKSKDHHDIMDSMEQIIASYNARGHHITAFCSDSEAICLSLATPLGLYHAHITHTTPDAHCHKVERAIQQIDQKAIAILESLPYFLPPKLILYLKKYCADCINLTCSSTQHPASTPYVLFHGTKPQLNSHPSKALTAFGTVCLIKHTDGQRATLASKLNMNLHHVPKASIGVKLGFDQHHPGDDIFFCPPSTTPLIRNNFEVVSIIPFDWKPKQVLQQTYITNINPTYEDILLRNDYPQPDSAIDQLTLPGPITESAQIDPVTSLLLPTPNFPVSDTPPATGPDHLDPDHHSNLPSTLAQILPNLTPTPPPRRYPIHTHRVPSHLACNLNTLPVTTKSSLFVSSSEQTEFSIKKGLLMQDYKHAVGPAINKELTKMFITYKALVFIDKSDIVQGAPFFRFFMFLKLKFLPDHSFERMSARLCAMETTPAPDDAETAYAATGDHHLFLLTVNAVLAAAIQGGFRDKLEFQRYDVPAAFLQCKLPGRHYGRLSGDLGAPYANAYVQILRCIYGARVSNKIFDDDHAQLLLSLGYTQFEGDLRKFKITCPIDPNVFVIINTHVDDGGAILTWRSKYDETLQALSDRYPGTLDSSPMDRYLGMGFSYNPDTGAMTASMYHSVLKVLATFCTSSLPEQSTPYTMDLFDISEGVP